MSCAVPDPGPVWSRTMGTEHYGHYGHYEHYGHTVAPSCLIL